MQKKKLIILIILTLALTLLKAGHAAPEEITLSQYSGTVGTKVTVNGTGFAPDAVVWIYW